MPQNLHIENLKKIVGSKAIISDATSLAPHLTDWRARYHGRAIALAKPQNSQEVAQLVKYCALHKINILPQGGNTSLCGAATPDESGNTLIINLSLMQKVRELDRSNRTITVESGCILANIQEKAAQANLLFPLHLGAAGSCQIGGNISTNAGGIHVMRYGNMRDLTLGLEVVLPSGEIWSDLNKLRKNSCAYDLKHCFIGAEGSLGVITAATLKLFPVPSYSEILWLNFNDIDQAINFLRCLQDKFGEIVSAYELMSRESLDLVAKYFPQLSTPKIITPWVVICEIASFIPLGEQINEFLSESNQNGCLVDAILSQSIKQSQQLWQRRELIPEAQKMQGISVKHDIGLPISNLAEFIKMNQNNLSSRFPNQKTIIFGHLGDGSLHYNVSFSSLLENTDSPTQTDQLRSKNQMEVIAAENEINALVFADVQIFGGTISAEHGIGVLNRQALFDLKPHNQIALMKSIKQSLDPDGIMNRGKIFL